MVTERLTMLVSNALLASEDPLLICILEFVRVKSNMHRHTDHSIDDARDKVKSKATVAASSCKILFRCHGLRCIYYHAKTISNSPIFAHNQCVTKIYSNLSGELLCSVQRTTTRTTRKNTYGAYMQMKIKNLCDL
jgi:hypothetical protein